MSARGVAFAVGASGSLFLSLGVGLALQPDVEYLTGGVGLFPSPLGSLLGSWLGVTGLALAHALAWGVILAGLISLRPPVPVLLLGLPALVWAVFLGVDAVAGVLFAAGYLSGRRWLMWLSVGFHLAALVLVVAVARLRFAAPLLLVGVVVLLLTPYRAALGVLSSHGLAGLAFGSVVGALCLAAALCGRVPLSGELVRLTGGVILSVAYVASWDASRVSMHWTGLGWNWHARYALPVVLIVLAASAVGRQAYGRTERPKTAPGSERTMRLKTFALTVAVAALAALLVVPAAFAQTVPAVPVGDYGDSLLTSLASAIGQIFPYAAAITAFAIGVGMVKRWLGHRKATRV